MFRAEWIRWLQTPPLRGWLALLCALFAVWIPTVIRFSFNGVITGCEFTPYLPFVFACAVLLAWWEAAAVALGCVAVMGGLFTGNHHFGLPCFLSSALMFLGSSAAMIGVALLIRRAMRALQARGADESSGGIVFSLEKGEVWASWYGQGTPVLLGSQRKVSEMMKDFLAQEELGRRLNGE